MSQRKSTRHPGVYTRAIASRRHGGKPDLAYDITYQDNGRKVWEKVGAQSEGYTAAMAAQVLAERKRTLRHGDLLPPKVAACPTLGQAWKSYRDGWLFRPKAGDPRRYLSCWRTHLEPLQGTLLRQITPAWLDALAARLLSSRSEQTVRHVLALIQRTMRYAARSGRWTGKDPFSGYSLPSADNARTRYLRPDEAEALLDALSHRSQVLARMALVTLHTGLRLGELHALRWEYVDIPGRTVLVMDTKGGRNRAVPLTDRAAQALAVQDERTGPVGLVFPGRGGKQRVDVSDTYSRVVQALGLNQGVADARQKVVWHTLRHTYASWLAIAGVSLHEIAALLGHSTEAMTRRYAHLCPDGLRRSILRVEAFSAPKALPSPAGHR